ncbi:MAG TPA: acetyltransferase [Bacteroidales bacterium]|jgi:sugar O-acyltransferase (sialic acid O-acetyltransferase NeuD family)|nr:acetyltransferase [Bacteroidales bacterium]
MNRIILVGGFHEIIELAEENSIQIAGIIDNSLKGTYRGYEIISNDENAGNLPDFYRSVPLIITPDKPLTRKVLYDYYSKLGFSFTSLISNKSFISESSKVNIGSVIQKGVNISSEAVIGKFVKLNSLCNVMHDSVVDDFTTVAPNAVILGKVRIGKHCYIGSNATILPGISICNNVTVGAGAVVTKDISTGGIYLGAPARLLIK